MKRRIPTLLAAFALGAAGASVASASAAGATAHEAIDGACPNVLFIGARGSGEKFDPRSQDVGDAVNIMARAMSTELRAHGLTMRVDGDPYPAAPVSDLYPSHAEAIAMAPELAPAADAVWVYHVHKYLQSISAGIADAKAIATHELSQCPAVALVMAGYSQGAMVMHQVELQLAKAHQTDVLDHIAGTLLLGDGDRVPKTKAKLFGTSKHGEGIRSYLDGFVHTSNQDVESPTDTANICNENDIVCEFDPKKLLRDHNPFAIIAAFKHAGSVHTHYATNESKPLDEAAAWLAAKIVAAQPTAQPIPPAPPPVPLAPPPSVPPSGPTLVYDAATALPPEDESPSYTGDRTFEDWATSTAQPVEVQETLPSSLVGYRCVVLLTNESLASGAESELTGYLQEGGTVLALGEHEGGGYDLADEALSRYAQSLGVGLALVLGNHDFGPNVTGEIDPSPLDAGVSALGDNWTSLVEVSGLAESLAGTADGEGTLIGAQAVDGGEFVLTGDSNLFTDENQGFYEDDDNGQFARDLCP